ncbi:MAG TPA: hypothetical protein VN711_04735 [Candidatus Saccharimonadales bacterium]|nr:hypothetical protein [Candidatus Saccharimonadales bacterium]
MTHPPESGPIKSLAHDLRQRWEAARRASEDMYVPSSPLPVGEYKNYILASLGVFAVGVVADALLGDLPIVPGITVAIVAVGLAKIALPNAIWNIKHYGKNVETFANKYQQFRRLQKQKNPSS